jgi:RNA polymerase sigma factor (sigma-70 family)
VLARARAALDQPEEAAAALAALREIEAAVGTQALQASVDFVAGLLAAARGDHDRARPLLEDACDRFDRSGGPFEAALARIELATTLVALGRNDVARQEAAAALNQLLALGAEPDAERARRLHDVATGREEAAVPLPELTPREREVLSLVSEGLTNRQIAERLVVSEHTIHRHVTNILRKLGLPSRAAAAALAARHGLLEEPDI